MKTLSLKVPEKLDAKLTRLAKRRGMSKSEVVRELLEQADDMAPSGLRSFRDMAPDLVGSVRGPGDLLTNPKHMEGFGVD